MANIFDKNLMIDAKVAKDQRYINQRVLDLLGDHIHSILLCGGFGRKEGSVAISGDDIKIINDYDIIIVLKEKNAYKILKLYIKYKNYLKLLADEIANALKIKQVDLALKPLAYFKNNQPLKIENYEVKKGHILTYGSDDPTISMPNWDVRDIPLFEGIWLFRNRGAGMLLAIMYLNRRGKIAEANKENFVIECNKAQLAMGDSILLLKRKYHHLYAERLKIAESINVSDIPFGKIIIRYYMEALKQKLTPDFKKLYQRNLSCWWFEIVGLMDVYYRFFESRRLNRNIGCWIEYADLNKPESSIDYKVLIKSICKRNGSIFSLAKLKKAIRDANKANSISIVSLLLFSLKKDEIIMPMLKKAAHLLDSSITEDSKSDWHFLVKRFLAEWHPDGAVAKIL